MLSRVFLLLSFLAGVTLSAANAPVVALPLRPATAREAELLQAALEKTAGDLRRWAYTESRVIKDEKGKVKSDVLIRYDPSKPYAEQWTPLKINGQAPTAAD